MNPSSVLAADARTMSANAPIVISRNRKAAASLRKGLSIRRDLLEKVDRRVHDDPHYVDEVPVDPGQLDPVVVLGREVPPEATDDHHQQQAEADEDMRPVEARQPEEHGRERAV